MRRVLLTSIALISVVGSAPSYAADMPMKAAPAPMMAAYSWTGCYVGGHFGGGWSRTDTTNVNGNAAEPAGTQHSADQNGWLGGFQAGCNYQFDPRWVVGFEGDYSWSGINGDDSRFSDVPGFTTSRLSSSHTEIRWLATATARLGYAWNNWLFYAKGGAAWANKTEDGRTTDPTAGNLLRAITSGDDTRIGWTAGAGVEWGFWNNWSAKVEYDYSNFGTRTEARNATYFVVPPGLNPLLRDVDFTMHTVKVGLNYRFNFFH